MPGIQTSIELQDGFSGVLDNIVNSVNMAVIAMNNLQNSMGSFQVGNFGDVSNEINQATASLNQFNATVSQQQGLDEISNDVSTMANRAQQAVDDINNSLNNIDTTDIREAERQIRQLSTSISNMGNSEEQIINIDLNPILPEPLVENPEPIQTDIQPNAPPEPIEIPITWQTDTLDVFTGTGIERFNQEVQSTNAMLEQLNSTQHSIQQTSESMEILPDEARNDISSLVTRLQEVQQKVDEITSNPLNIGTDESNAQLERLRQQLDRAIQEQDQLNQAMQDMDITSANQAYLNLTQTISNAERYIRDSMSNIGPIDIPITWQTDTLDVFTGTGIERFNQEVQSTNAMLEQLNSTQHSIQQTSESMEILPDEARNDISSLVTRLQEVQQKVDEITSNPLNIGTDESNAQLERLRQQLDRAIQEQDQLNQAMQDMDITSANQAYLNLTQTISNAERYIRDSMSNIGPIDIPITWQTDTLDVFTGTGIERFNQEVQSTNNMLQQLNSTQHSIQQTAESMEILPDVARNDISSLSLRLEDVQQRINQITSNPLNIGSNEANAQLERLRHLLDMAVQAQGQLNEAMQGMDISTANQAYLNLSQIISSIEMYIRNNTDEQGRFNEQIQAGSDNADNLVDKIKNVVAAYAGIQTVEQIIDTSDSLAQTTSRLDMMNDGLQSTNELVNMVYAAAQDSRGSFNEMADVVARFGNNAKEAFSSSEEVVAFTDLIQKQMTIAGASTQEAANAQLQLSQALGSGVLRGDELNSIFDQSPNLIRGIADYIEDNDDLLDQMASGIKMKSEDLKGNVMGHIRDIASEGMISADIVKASVFSSADDINSKFASMPMTWSQIWTYMKNAALIAFQPVLQRINDLANSDMVKMFVSNIVEAMAVLANVMLNIFNIAGSIGSFIVNNWSIISPIVYGIVVALGAYLAVMAVVSAMTAISTAITKRKAAADAMAAGDTFLLTVNQYGLNAALAACPLTWIIVMIIALIAVIVALCNWIAKVTGIAQSGIGVITGALATAVAFILNILIGLANYIINIGINIWNFIANFAAAFGVIFNNPVATIKATILSMFNFIVGVVGKAAAILDAVFGSNLAGAVSGFQDKVQTEINSTIEGAGGTTANTLNASDYTIDRINYGDAFNAGAAWGDGIADKVSNFSLADVFGKVDMPNIDDYVSGFNDVIANADAGDIGANLGDVKDSTGKIANDTGNISDALDITEEDLKYLRDIAEQEAINRYTTAEIKIDMSGMQNNINSDDDIDGFVTKLTESVNEAVYSMTEGVHE